MKRQLSKRESVLLLILCIILIGCLYYLVVDQPARNITIDAQSRLAEAETSILVDSARLEDMRSMQAALESINEESVASVPDYDNVRSVVNLLNQAMLSASTYSISFQPVDTSNAIVCRTIDIAFTSPSYQDALRILTTLHDGPYRCEIVSLSINSTTNPDAVPSLEVGPVSVSFTVNFYEFQPYLA